MLMSQSTDVFKTGEPPPKSICYCWNFRSGFLATFCIDPNNTIVQVPLEFRRDKRINFPGHNTLVRHIKVECDCFDVHSFCRLNGSSIIKMFTTCEDDWPRANSNLVLPVTICTMPASSVNDPGRYSWPIKCDVTVQSTNESKIMIIHF